MATAERLIIEAMFPIVNKDGFEVPFILNSAQAKVDANLTGRDIIPKARQEGVSSYFLARSLAKCISLENQNCVIISHDTKSTQKMLQKVHYMCDHMKGAQPVIGTSNRNEISFPKKNSYMYIGTAGQKKFGRGDTINVLHCSEVAMWEKPNELLSGLFQAVPVETGEISLESTGKGKGNYYHRACMRAYRETGRYRLHFLDWQSFSEYDLHVEEDERQFIMSNLDPDYDEPELVEKFGLTAGQIKFRRFKLEEMDFDTKEFEQEYPMTLDQCFQSTGYGIFIKYNYIPTDDWVRVEKGIHALTEIWKRPPAQYVIGADVAAGVGRDASVADIYDVVTGEQVAQYISDKIAPDDFGTKLIELGKKFNSAFINCEGNNHGVVALKVLRDKYPRALLYRTKLDSDNITHYGYKTTVRTKPILINEFRSDVIKDLTLHSPYTIDEMSTFTETDGGKLEAEEGCHDDTVIAAALANIAIPKAILAMGSPTPLSHAEKVKRANDPFSVEGGIQAIRERDGTPDHLDNVIDFPLHQEQV